MPEVKVGSSPAVTYTPTTPTDQPAATTNTADTVNPPGGLTHPQPAAPRMPNEGQLRAARFGNSAAYTNHAGGPQDTAPPQPGTLRKVSYRNTAEAIKNFGAAVKEATQGGRKVLVIFGEYWCHNCHELRDWATNNGIDVIYVGSESNKDPTYLSALMPNILGNPKHVSNQGIEQAERGIPVAFVLDPKDTNPVTISAKKRGVLPDRSKGPLVDFHNLSFDSIEVLVGAGDDSKNCIRNLITSPRVEFGLENVPPDQLKELLNTNVASEGLKKILRQPGLSNPNDDFLISSMMRHYGELKQAIHSAPQDKPIFIALVPQLQQPESKWSESKPRWDSYVNKQVGDDKSTYIVFPMNEATKAIISNLGVPNEARDSQDILIVPLRLEVVKNLFMHNIPTHDKRFHDIPPGKGIMHLAL
ncbi:MAG: hypothetical protein HYU97_09565 [Deltaproteobacteria bacterium]|nr:hypothetical protein [Deltaproteobacteria bacterium]